MKTIKQFINFRKKCPLCASELGLTIKGFGIFDRVSKHKNAFCFERTFSEWQMGKNSSSGDLIIKIDIRDNKFEIDICAPYESNKVFDAIPLTLINKYRAYEKKRTTNDQLINQCLGCSYKYYTTMSLDFDKSKVIIVPVEAEIFSIAKQKDDMITYYDVINDLAHNSTSIMQYNNFTNGSIGEPLDVADCYCDPSNIQSLVIEKIDLLYMLS